MKIKKTIFLHIGLPKTGTTYLQWQLKFNHDLLQKHDIYIPRTGQNNGLDHNKLANCIRSSEHNEPGSLWQKLLKEIGGANQSKILISGECFSLELFSFGHLTFIKKYLSEYNLKIIVTTRGLSEFFHSLYKHLLRHGRVNYSFKDMLQEFNHINHLKNFWINGLGIHELDFIEIKYSDIKGPKIHKKFISILFNDTNLDKNLKTTNRYNLNTSISLRAALLIEELNQNNIDTNIMSPIIELMQNKNYTNLDHQTFLKNHEENQLLMSDLVPIIEERTRSLEWLLQQNFNSTKYLLDLQQKKYVESIKINKLNGFLKKIKNKRINFICASSKAIDSQDQLNPQSTLEGKAINSDFVNYIKSKFGDKINVLDIGTGAGGLVFDFLSNEILAYGIDGADYSKNNSLGFWGILKDFLYTADATKPFKFLSNNKQFKFDLITAWEFLEHIPEEKLPSLFNNICNNLTNNGYFICSISLLEYQPYHVTLKPKDWWVQIMKDSGLTVVDRDDFNYQFFYRGVGSRYEDPHNYFTNPDSGFHLVMKKD